jgi:DNA polymerase III delta' subunit
MLTKQWEHLIKRWRNDQLPHALLLSGSKEINKQTFALRFAKLVLCQQGANSNEACDNCVTCHLFNAETHPDFHLIQPIDAKTIKIDQIRDLIAKLNQTAQQGGYKVIIVTPAEALPTAAANALLKTLEEPAAKTVFFLISDSPALLPATIRSRCQSIIFSNTDTTQTQQTESYQKLVNNLKDLTQNKIDPIQLAAQWFKKPVEQIVANLTLITMDTIRTQSSADVIPAQAGIQEKLFLYLDQLYQLRSQPQINLNQQLLLENLFCGWQELKEI